MAVTQDLIRLIPAGTTHFTVETRYHRGQELHAVVAIIPHGASIVMTAFDDPGVARQTAQELAATLPVAS